MFVPLLATDFFERAVEQYGKKVGVIDGEKRFTYSQFGERANRLSNGLLSLGIEKGDRVAVIDINSHRLFEMYYAVPRIGAVLLPINIRFAAKEVSYVLNDAEAKCLIVNQDMEHLVRKDELRTVETLILVRDGPTRSGFRVEGEEYEELLSRSSPVMEKGFELDENDAAEMFYTSGTTGKPKGMIYTHRMLWLCGIRDLVYGWGIGDRTIYLQAIPLFHANGWGQPHAMTARCGTHVVLRQFRPQVVCELIQRERVTHTSMVPTMADTLVQYGDIDKYDLSSLRYIGMGGAFLSQRTQEALEKRFPGCLVHAAYGLSENTSSGAQASLKDYLKDISDEERKRRMRSGGFADMPSKVRIVNEKGEGVRRDGKETGEIIIRGNNVIDEYWRLPEETKKTIIDGWLHTGDIATIDEDGYIEIKGRKKDMIISGGENIGALEIENVIASHPAVLEVAVVAAPHEKWGETPAALVVLKEGQKITEEELKAYCRESLGGFKIPTIVEVRDSLPKGGTGKILKTELKKKFWEGREAQLR
jgi:fatty-acyl-CoA synthase